VDKLGITINQVAAYDELVWCANKMKKDRENMNTVTVRPTSDRIVVQRDEAAEITPGGIVIPGEARDKPVRGVVVAVGPGLLLADGERGPMEVCEGDRVVFGTYGGTEVEVEGDTLTVMRESEVLFIE